MEEDEEAKERKSRRKAFICSCRQQEREKSGGRENSPSKLEVGHFNWPQEEEEKEREF